MTTNKATPAAEDNGDETGKPEIAAPKKLTKGEEQALLVAELTSRVEKLEANQKIIVDGFQFVANETRPLYGFGAIALVFDAIHDKLTK